MWTEPAPVPVLPMTLTIVGAPRTKKNHGKVIARTKNGRTRRFHVPSDAYTAWVQAVAVALGPQILKLEARKRLPIAKEMRLNCRALFYRDANTGDAVGYYQGFADLLEHIGVLQDDVSIVQWDGSRLLKDAVDPRVECVLSVVE